MRERINTYVASLRGQAANSLTESRERLVARTGEPDSDTDRPRTIRTVTLGAAIAGLNVAIAACGSSSIPESTEQMPDGFPQEIPAPPNSVLVGTQDFTGGGAAGVARGVTYDSTEAVDTIHEFYQQKLSVAPWFISAVIPSDDPATAGYLMGALNGPMVTPADSPSQLALLLAQTPTGTSITINFAPQL